MKEELLDIEAVLSQVAADLSAVPPNVEEAKAKLSDARDRLLRLADSSGQFSLD